MSTLLRIEYAVLFVFSLILFSFLDYAWWWYLVLFLLPDLGIIGYSISPRVGSFTYNATHFLGTALMLYVLGVVLGSSTLVLLGVISFGHSSLDRVFGFGLKYPDSFKHTHLGQL